MNKGQVRTYLNHAADGDGDDDDGLMAKATEASSKAKEAYDKADNEDDSNLHSYAAKMQMEAHDAHHALAKDAAEDGDKVAALKHQNTANDHFKQAVDCYQDSKTS